MRDVQKSRLYAAETFVDRLLDSVASSQVRTVDFYGSTLVIPDERKFGDLDGIQRYADAVLALNWVRATYPAAARPVTVRRRKGSTRAHYEPLGAVLAFPDDRDGRFTMRESYVLHELAHHLSPERGHGPAFASTYLHLVREVMGPEVGLLLTDAFTRSDVRFGVLAAV